MRKIAAYIKCSENADTVKKFCESEGFEYLDITQPNIVEYDYSVIVVITDQSDIDLIGNTNGVPIASIGKNQNFDKASYELSEKFTMYQLRCLIDVAYHGGSLANFTHSFKPLELSMNFSIQNDIFNIDKIVYNITKEFVYFFKISELQKIRIGISEIITNAIEHGNFEITGEQKFQATEDGIYLDLINEKMKDPKYANRTVNVNITVNESLLEVLVKDDGKGFDTSELNKESSEDDLLKLHGRGVMITKMYFDKIIYNDVGNEAKLIKRKK